MLTWLVTLEFRPPDDYEIASARLGWHSSAVTMSGQNEDGHLYLQHETRASNAWLASTAAFEMLEDDIARGLIPQPDVIRIHRKSGREPVPRLVGLSEIARMLDITRQRVAQLASQANFPVAIARLAMGPVFTERSVSRFIDERKRKAAGQPRRSADR